MALIRCPECDTDRVSSLAEACPHCGFPIKDGVLGPETELLSVSPRLFGGNWLVAFMVAVSSIAFVGLLVLIPEWLRVRNTRLTVTNRRTILREGILDRRTNELRHEDILNVQVSQGFAERIFGVGTLELSSAAQGGVEITVKGLPNPARIAQLILSHQ